MTRNVIEAATHGSFTVTLDLPQPPAVLFRYLADPRNRPEWQSSPAVA